MATINQRNPQTPGNQPRTSSNAPLFILGIAVLVAIIAGVFLYDNDATDGTSSVEPAAGYEQTTLPDSGVTPNNGMMADDDAVTPAAPGTTPANPAP